MGIGRLAAWPLGHDGHDGHDGHRGTPSRPVARHFARVAFIGWRSDIDRQLVGRRDVPGSVSRLASMRRVLAHRRPQSQAVGQPHTEAGAAPIS